MVLDQPAPAVTGPEPPGELPGPHLPGWVLVSALLVLLVNSVVLLAGTASVGVSWDEPIHTERLRTYQATGWYLPERQMDDGQPAEDVRGVAVYAPVAALTGHAVAVVLGSERRGSVSTTPQAYAHRHLAVALLGLLCLAAVALIVRLLVGSWRWGLLGAAVLSAFPVWIGHAMFNIKDAPVATGYTLVTAGAVALAGGGIATSRRRQVVAAAALAAGSVLAMGTRPGMAPAVVAAVALALLGGALVDRRSGRDRATGRRVALAASGLGSAYVILLLVYPALFARADLLVSAVLDSGEYPWEGVILTAGQSLSMPPPPSYLPLWFAAQTPLVLLALALVGLVASGLLLARTVRRATPDDGDLGVGLSLVAAQALLLPVIAVLTSAVLYDATRQVLFVQPALATAATMGAWLIARRTADRRWLRGGLFLAVVLGMVVPTASHARLFPYDYVWFNAAAAMRPIDGSWMTEYWRVSARELVAHMPEGGFPSCRPWSPDRLIISCETQPQYNVYWETRGEAEPETVMGPGEYFLAEVNRYGSTVPDGCSAVHEVTRPLFGQDVLMSAVSRCSIPLLPYPEGGISSADGAARGYAITGWVPPVGDPVRSYRVPATVAFVLPTDDRATDLRLSLRLRSAETVAEPITAVVRVNGSPVAERRVSPSTSGLVVTVPAAVADTFGDGRVYVEISLLTGGRSGDRRLLSFDLSRLTAQACRASC